MELPKWYTDYIRPFLYVYIFPFLMVLLNLNAPLQWAICNIGKMAEVLVGNRHRTFLDIIAGIIKVGETQEVPPSDLKVPKPKNDWISLDLKPENDALIRRCVDMAMATYSFPTYTYFGWLLRPLTFWRTIAFLRPFHFFQYRSDRAEVVGDCEFSYIRTAAFLASGGLDNGFSNLFGLKNLWNGISQLRYACWVNGVSQTPYCIVTDDDTKSIIIAIRGSTSINDFLTDGGLYAGAVPSSELKLKEWLKDFKGFSVYVKQPDDSIKKETRYVARMHLDDGPVPVMNVHNGMLLCAKTMYGNVERILMSLLSPSPLNGTPSKYEGYNIVVTGHSLGAGVASLLTLMLRPKFEKVRGYCFSPPGCMVGTEGVELSQECILSFVVGDDIVPRLSFHSMNGLGQQCEKEMGTANFSAFRTIMLFNCYLATYPFVRTFNAIKSFLKKSPPVASREREFSDQLEPSPELDTDTGVVRLYTPGLIMHLVEKDNNISQEWINQEELQTIIVSGKMVADHMAKRVQRIVKKEHHLTRWIPFLPAYVRTVIEIFY